MKRACGLVLMAVMAGCQLNVRPGAEGIFDAFDHRLSPVQMAVMATNPYNANDRYRGTLGLAGASFAGEPVYIRLFETNIRDRDPAVRTAAARGLANHGEPRHVPLLVEALKDRHAMVRLEAARGLQRLHDPAAIGPLMGAIREPDVRNPGSGEADPEVRAEAADALGQYDDLTVLHALVAALDDSDLAVNRRALRSLRTLTGQDLGLNRGAWAQWLGRADDPFAGRGMYTYPVYSRHLRLYEYIPLIPKPLNETPAPPAGMPRG